MAGEAEHSASSVASPKGSSSSSLFSPRFRTVAALAGWDEEAILASLIVEDTPVQEPSTRKKRFRKSKTPTNGSSRKTRSQTRSPPSPIPAVSLCLDEAENSKGEIQGSSGNAKDEIKKKESNFEVKKDSSGNSSLPCMDRLREELSCAICLDICFEPTTTPCGHSFCLNCLKCAAVRCGKKCPKCRQLISNGRSCTINTVLWNTIQLLFPKEVESRQKAVSGTSSSPRSGSKRKRKSIPETGTRGIITSGSSHSTEATNNTRNPTTTNTTTGFWTSTSSRRWSNSSAFILSSELVSTTEIARARRPSDSGNGRSAPTTSTLRGNRSSGHGLASTSRPLADRGNDHGSAPTSRPLAGGGGIRRATRREAAVPSQSEDAALALRLQREEFLGLIGEGTNRPQQQPQLLGVQLARANLRALAARAVRTSTRNMSP